MRRKVTTYWCTTCGKQRLFFREYVPLGCGDLFMCLFTLGSWMILIVAYRLLLCSYRCAECGKSLR
jgi:hypothetical protein